MSTATLLAAAASKVSSPSTWTRGTNARDSSDQPVPVMHASAVKWDIVGALIRAHHDEEETLANFHSAYAVIRGNIPPGRRNQDPESYNDELDHGDVASMFQE